MPKTDAHPRIFRSLPTRKTTVKSGVGVIKRLIYRGKGACVCMSFACLQFITTQTLIYQGLGRVLCVINTYSYHKTTRKITDNHGGISSGESIGAVIFKLAKGGIIGAT